MKPMYIPVTPAGTSLGWLMSETEEGAWKALLRDAQHMPWRGVEGFKERGYTVVQVVPVERKEGRK